MGDPTPRPATSPDPEAEIRRVLADPMTIRENRDRGAAAEFIRDAVATRCGAVLMPEQGNQREARRRHAHILDLPAELRRVSSGPQPEAEAGT